MIVGLCYVVLFLCGFGVIVFGSGVMVDSCGWVGG